jgi:plasmid stability protein
VPALHAYHVGMQYTLRNIPKRVDQALRKKAKSQGRSLNDVAVEALAIATGMATSEKPVKRRDLSDIAGTWVEDPEFDKIIAEQDQIDPEMWR